MAGQGEAEVTDHNKETEAKKDQIHNQMNEKIQNDAKLALVQYDNNNKNEMILEGVYQ